MLVGLIIAVPLVVFTAGEVAFSNSDIFHLVVSGIGNSAGLLLVYTALQRGKVGVVGPIVSTEGAIGAALSIILGGDPVTVIAVVLMAVVTIGVVMSATEPSTPAAAPEIGGVVIPNAAITAALALGGAILFGLNLYATGRIASELPIAWAILPARLAGVLGVTVPLVLLRRIRLVRPAVPLILLVGVCEVAGAATYAFGARESAAITSVIASQFAGIAALVAFLLFGERLGRLQVAGVIVIAIGVGALAAVQA